MRLSNGVLEQDGQIVNDSVAAGDLLEELRRGTDNHATEVLRGTTSEEIRERGLLSAGASQVSICILYLGGEKGRRTF